MNDAFLANAAEVLANTAIAAAMGGDVKRDLPHETYYAQLRRHHTSGEDYYLTFTRKTLRLSSYQDEAIRSTVEDWADAVGTLDWEDGKGTGFLPHLPPYFIATLFWRGDRP